MNQHKTGYYAAASCGVALLLVSCTIHTNCDGSRSSASLHEAKTNRLLVAPLRGEKASFKSPQGKQYYVEDVWIEKVWSENCEGKIYTIKGMLQIVITPVDQRLENDSLYISYEHGGFMDSNYMNRFVAQHKDSVLKPTYTFYLEKRNKDGGIKAITLDSIVLKPIQ